MRNSQTTVTHLGHFTSWSLYSPLHSCTVPLLNPEAQLKSASVASGGDLAPSLGGRKFFSRT